MTNLTHAPSNQQRELLKRIVNKIIVFKKDVEVCHYVGKDKVLGDSNAEILRLTPQNDSNQKKYITYLLGFYT